MNPEHPYIAALRDLGLPPGGWALHGTGPLLLRGWLDDVGDLDVIAREEAWDLAQRLGQPSQFPDGNPIRRVDLGINITRTWHPLPETVTVDDLINSAEMINGIPCVTLDHIIAYKRTLDRPKDRHHLSIIQQHTRP